MKSLFDISIAAARPAGPPPIIATFNCGMGVFLWPNVVALMEISDVWNLWYRKTPQNSGRTKTLTFYLILSLNLHP